MANVIQLKRGAESARTGFTPAAGEPIYATDTNKLYIGDGSTAVQTLNALGGAIDASNGSNNRVVTFSDSDSLNGEANLTFDGSTLAVSGDATVSDDLGLISDGALLTFGASSEVKFIHEADVGLKLKHTATADDKPVFLTLQTGEVDMAADDIIGGLRFQAPDEGAGTDAILVAAAIEAVSEGDFAADNNATSLVFKTGSSAVAAARLKITSAGHVVPTSDDAYDLGTSSLQFRNAYIDGTLEADVITIGGTNVVSGSLITTLGTISAGVWEGTAIASAQIAGDAITGAKIADDAVDSEHLAGDCINSASFIADDVIDSEHLAGDLINSASFIADDVIDSEHLAGDLINSHSFIADGVVQDEHLADDVATGLAGAGTTATSGVVNVIGGTGMTANANDIAVSAAQTSITSIINSGFTDIGTAADEEYIKFDTANEINTMINNTERLSVTATGVDVTGNLSVSGDTTVVNILAGAVSNTIQFEGSSDDGNETTLTVTDPTADRTITLPNATGTVALTTNPTALTISKDVNGEFTALILVNEDDDADTAGAVSMRFDLEDTAGNAVDAGKIKVEQTTDMTSTGASQDSKMVFATSLNGTLTDYLELLSTGGLIPTSDNTVDLGTSSLEFKDAYFDGTVETDALTIGGTNIISGSIVTTLGTISAGVWEGTAIASGYIAADAITGAKIADDAVDTEHIADDAIEEEQIGAGEVKTAAIADDAVTLAKMDGLASTKIILGNGSGNPAAVVLSGDATMANDGAVSLAAAQTNVTSLLATDIKIGEDDQTKIDFETVNTINYYLNNAKDFVMTANTFTAESGSSIVVPASGLTIGSTAVTSTAAELNLLDGVSGLVQADFTKLAAVDSTAAELNIIDGGTSATSTTLASADRMVVNDNGTMVQVALSDLVTYLENSTASGFNVDGGTYA